MGNCTGQGRNIGDYGNSVNGEIPQYNLVVKSATWARDSHELYDYES